MPKYYTVPANYGVCATSPKGCTRLNAEKYDRKVLANSLRVRLDTAQDIDPSGRVPIYLHPTEWDQIIEALQQRPDGTPWIAK